MSATAENLIRPQILSSGKGVLPKDLAPLHQLLNEERKAVFYEGEDPDLGELSIEEVLEDLLVAVEIAERDAG